MKKFKAFTLFELVLAMMLAAVVTGMCYTALTLFTRMYGSYEAKNLAYADLQLTQQVLQRDFAQAQVLRLSEGALTLEPSAISYQPITDGLIRAGITSMDTLKLNALSVETQFETQRTADEGLVDHLILHFKHAGLPTTISIRKRYTAQELLNQTAMSWK